MKILSIGNSFSQDAHKWLKPICESAGEEIYNVNLFIGGCSLEMHWNNFVNDSAAYDFEVAGVCQKKSSIREALQSEKWDVITFQQARHDSGLPETYVPYLKCLADEVRKICPGAKFYIHQTWAYELDSNHGGFANYHNDQKEMFRKLTEAYKEAGRMIDGEMIPVGTIIQYLREKCPEFDYKNGGLSLNRDGFHLSQLYGRYAAALTWYCCLLGGDVRKVSFVPRIEEETTDESLLEVIKKAVQDVFVSRTYYGDGDCRG